MKAEIFLDEGNHNGINLDGILVEFFQGGSGSTIVMKDSENSKKLKDVFCEFREGDKKTMREGLIKESVCILNEDGTEILYFPVPVRVHII